MLARLNKLRLAIFERNLLYIWILILLAFALILILTFSGCSKQTGIKEKTSQEITGNVVEGTCSDTDGINEKVKGIVKGTFKNGSNYLFDDECKGFIFLVEYYCEGNTPMSKNFRCDCSKGTCV